MKTVNSVALYPRLSSADFKGGKLIDESRSIRNQRSIMTEYCNKRGWNIHEIYDKDDGVSGTTFQRDDFLRMMSDVERGFIDCIIVIDLSRFGRNYSEAGLYRNKLQEQGVRLIAINDNYDSLNDVGQAMNIEVPIKEIFNEYYPAQVSQKVRAVKRMMSEQGHFCNSRAPYGYQQSSTLRIPKVTT